MPSIKIIHEPNAAEPFVVLEKPPSLPSAPLSPTDEKNALYQAIKLFPQIKNIHGKKEIEYGLLHRIDTATQGLLLIATNQEFYDHILRVHDKGEFIKTYFAECDFDANNAKKLGGFPDSPSGTEIVSYFRAYGKGSKEVRPVLENSNSAALKKIGAKKLYSTKILSLEQAGGTNKITCSIAQGFRHQVRCHLAWCGYPVKGDAIYNHDFRTSMPNDSTMKFFATVLQFPDLHSDKQYFFAVDERSYF